MRQILIISTLPQKERNIPPTFALNPLLFSREGQELEKFLG